MVRGEFGMKRILASVLALIVSSSAASAITQTFEATINNVQGSAALLSELGISSGDSLTVQFALDTDVSSGAIKYDQPNYSYSYLYSTYEFFKLISPQSTIYAVDSDAANHRVYSQDGISDGLYNISDYFQVGSFSGGSAATPYIHLYLYSFDRDEGKWDRNSPLSANVLNSFSTDFFDFRKSIDGIQQSIYSQSIDYKLVTPAPVPLPASLPVFLIGLTGLGLVARKRRNKA